MDEREKNVRISARQVDEISNKLINVRSAIPNCFARKPRSLSEVDRWKATEFRQFLLYTGKLALDGILRPDLYAHFMCLSIASIILVSPELVQTHWKYAGDLLVYFVEQGAILYGKEFLVYNVHSLLHLAAQAKRFGGLDKCSSFPFENYMCRLKRMVCSGNNPLSQLVKRLSEGNAIQLPETNYVTDISTKRPDNIYIVNKSSCCEVLEEINRCIDNGDTLYRCRVYEHLNPLFESPCDSRIVGVFQGKRRSARIKFLSSAFFQEKAIMFEVDNEETMIFMAILHDIF